MLIRALGARWQPRLIGARSVRRTLASAVAAQRSPGPSPTIWRGLQRWRGDGGTTGQRFWGPTGPTADGPALDAAYADKARELVSSCRDLTDAAMLSLAACDPLEKAAITHAAWRRLGSPEGAESAESSAALAEGPPDPPPFPGRPLAPELVPPRDIPTAKRSPLPLAVYMLHNLTHVELNAIDLAWDTVARFARHGLPRQFALDFAKVADDESRHLLWCLQRLQELGHGYGSMPAHNLLWEGAQISKGSLGARLAVVPMSQEARGLDAGPRLAARLVGLGDRRSAAIVARIAREESAHVAVGVAWFRALCHAEGRDPGARYRELMRALCPELLRPPFEARARADVGLPGDWYDPELWSDASGEQAATAAVSGQLAAGMNTIRGSDSVADINAGDHFQPPFQPLAERMIAYLSQEMNVAE